MTSNEKYVIVYTRGRAQCSTVDLGGGNIMNIIIAVNVKEEQKESVRVYIERLGDLVIFCPDYDLGEVISKFKNGNSYQVWAYDDDVCDDRVTYKMYEVV